MFKIGDAVVHPACGAGIVSGFEEFAQSSDVKRYYKIDLLGETSTSLMVPIKTAEELGLRPAIPKSQLRKIWRILRDDPNALPDEHKERYSQLETQLQAGNIIHIAETVRDMAWRQLQQNGLTGKGKRIYDRGMSLLVAELAATQGIDMADAEAQVRGRLDRSLEGGEVT